MITVNGDHSLDRTFCNHSLNRSRQTDHDARKNDKADSVSYAPFGDLFADPHDERGACGQRNHHHETEAPARSCYDLGSATATRTFQRDCRHKSLKKGQRYGQITGVLGYFLASQFALFGKLFQERDHDGGQLQNDRGRDIRHDPQGENAEALQRSAGEDVQKSENRAGLRLEQLFQRFMIDARALDKSSHAVDGKQAQHEQDALAQVGDTEDILYRA